jgi:hypothetical protein
VILELEREFHLGLGGFSALSSEEQARLLAYARVRSDPEGKTRKRTTRERVADVRKALRAR